MYFGQPQRFQVFWQNLEMLRWVFLSVFWATSAFPGFLAKPGNFEAGFFVSILGDLSVSKFWIGGISYFMVVGVPCGL